jgi:hypothetical protein
MTKNNAQDEQLVVYGTDWCPDVRRRIPTLVWGDSSYLVEPSDDELRAQLTVQR